MSEGLVIGARREIEVFDGRGGSFWAKATVIDTDPGEAGEKYPAVVFKTDPAPEHPPQEVVVRLGRFSTGAERIRPIKE